MSNPNQPQKKFIEHFLCKGGIAFFYLSIILLALFIPNLVDFLFPKQSITIYTFTEMIAPQIAQDFEKKTGIHVNIKYFETNQELHAKLRISKGEGYDLIVASDYIIETLIKEKLIQPLNHAKIPNIVDLDTKLMRHFYDPKNQYSLPLVWYVYGLVFDKQLFTSEEQYANLGLECIFEDPDQAKEHDIIKYPYKICMLDDAREAIMFAALYLFNTIRQPAPDDLIAIEELLIEQKQWIESYTNSSLQYFLFSGLTPISITSSAYMKKILKNSSRFGFQIPREGSVLVIENVAIPTKCSNVERTHQFINFLLSQKNAEINSKAYGYNPSNQHAYQATDSVFLENPNFFPDEKTFAKLYLVRQEYFSNEVTEKIWLSIKFA
jgi:spermidine/putrescine transport system substrate-binding protein